MKRWARPALALALAAGTLCASGAAQADYQRRVVLLEHPSASDQDHEITTRVRAELAAAGFEVVVLAASEGDPKQAVEGTGGELHPASVLLVERLEGGEAGTELWLADRLLHKTVVLRLRAEPRRAGTDPAPARSSEAARIAVQALELVKARLAELSLSGEPRTAAAAPEAAAPVVPRAPETRGARPNLLAGMGVLEGFQEGQQALTPVLRLGVTLPESWTGDVLALDVRGSFVGLGRAAHVKHGPGSASLRHTAVELGGVVRFAPRTRVQPFVSLGGGLLALDVAGEAPEPYRNDSERTLSGLFTASGGLWLQPVKGVGLALEGQLLSAWSKTIVRIAGEDAAEVAAPLLLLSGGLMVEF